MDKRIRDILNDLYKIDPQMKAHQKELSKLVSELLVSKPDTHFDEKFASRLRAELVGTNVKSVKSPYTSIFISRTFYGVLSSALTLLIAVPLTFIATQKATSPDKPITLNPFSNQVKNITSGLTPKQQISSKGMNAFGTLAPLATLSTPATTTTPSTGTGTALTPSVGTRSLIGRGQKDTTYTFVYKGDSVNLLDTDGKVFKRTKGIESGKQLSEIVRNSKFNLADLSTFANLSLKDIEMTEDKPFGYKIGVNFDEGAITINPQKGYWGTSTSQVSASSTLDASALISIADAFVKEHVVDMSIYGKPIAIQNASTVVYPLIIEGKQVYESDGTPFGLMIYIDNAQKKVLGVNNLTSQVYDSSLYKLESDFNNVLRAATSTLTGPAASKKTPAAPEADLGTPVQVLIHYGDLYMPALSFPITYSDNDPTHSHPTTIVIPLVKDFLNKKVTQ